MNISDITLAFAITSVVLVFAGVFVAGMRRLTQSSRTAEQSMQMSATTGQHLDRLTRAVETLEADNTRLRERVQNLEAIVTSEQWDVLSKGDAESRRALLDQMETEESDTAELAARLARKLR